MDTAAVRLAVAKIVALRAMQDDLFDELRVWCNVEDAGVRHEDVETLGFDYDKLTKEQLRQRKLATPPAWADWLLSGRSTTEFYNVAVLKNGERVVLKNIIKAARSHGQENELSPPAADTA